MLRLWPALALAGRPSEAIAVLEPAARQDGADATVRQNLALAHALAGDWDEARTIAAQDVPAGQLDARIQQWMHLAKPVHASDQVAQLVGVTPAAVDAGQPVQLALNKGDTQLAQAAPAPALQKAATAPISRPLRKRLPLGRAKSGSGCRDGCDCARSCGRGCSSSAAPASHARDLCRFRRF